MSDSSTPPTTDPLAVGIPQQPLHGQRALVTGGGRGLGTTISAHLAVPARAWPSPAETPAPCTGRRHSCPRAP
jgi:hypothetical protein